MRYCNHVIIFVGFERSDCALPNWEIPFLSTMGRFECTCLTTSSLVIMAYLVPLGWSSSDSQYGYGLNSMRCCCICLTTWRKAFFFPLAFLLFAVAQKSHRMIILHIQYRNSKAISPLLDIFCCLLFWVVNKYEYVVLMYFIRFKGISYDILQSFSFQDNSCASS